MRVHEIATWASWHGRLMVLAWVILLPLGVLIARFYKITPQQDWPNQLDNRFWWRSHLSLQYLGIGSMTVGAWLAWHYGHVRQYGLQLHGVVGWIVCFLGWSQILSGWLRGSKGGPQPSASAPPDAAIPGDHYDMSLRRRIFERLHKTCGYVALLLSALAIALALRMVDAPSWMSWIIFGTWLLGLSFFIHLQRSGRCRDTYQAIWGTDPAHPGNRVPPIGFGIRRIEPATESDAARSRK